MLREQDDIARIEPFSVVQVRFAPVPLPSPPHDRSQRLRNAAVIREQWKCLLKVTHRGVVILQTAVMVLALGLNSLAQIGLQSKGGFGGLARLFTQSSGWLQSQRDVSERICI